MEDRPEPRQGAGPAPSGGPGLAPLLERLGREALGAPVESVTAMVGGGSDRGYFRVHGGTGSAVAAHCGDGQTYRAFLDLTAHLAPKGIPVPRVLAADDAERTYVLEDLGPETLADRIARWHDADAGAEALAALERAVRWLPAIQLRGAEGLTDRLIGGNPALDPAGYRADVTLFLERYAKELAPAALPEAPARAALEALTERLGGLERELFCYRDFQSRNVMWPERGPVFLDYQSATRGPGAYDLASILYSPDSRLDEPGRAHLIGAYLAERAELGQPVEREGFLADFYRIVLLRRLQALGAYARIAQTKGDRGYLTRIPAALAALGELLAAGRFDNEPAALRHWLARVVENPPPP